MSGPAIVFVDEDFHQFSFPGELVLFADDFQEGDGVGEVEPAEVEALGGGFLRDAEASEESLAGASFDGLSQFLPPFHQGEDGAELVEVAVVDAGEVAHQFVVVFGEPGPVLLPIDAIPQGDGIFVHSDPVGAGNGAEDPENVFVNGEELFQVFSFPCSEVDVLDVDVSHHEVDEALEEASELVGVFADVAYIQASVWRGDGEGGFDYPLGLGLVAHGLRNAVVELGDGLFVA